jgi:hypothetical protein
VSDFATARIALLRIELERPTLCGSHVTMWLNLMQAMELKQKLAESLTSLTIAIDELAEEMDVRRRRMVAADVPDE